MTHPLTVDSVLRTGKLTRMRRFRGKMFVATAEQAYELDAVAEYIFRQVDGGTTIAQIAAKLAADYEVSDEQARTDIVELLEPFLEPGILEVVGA